MKDSCPFRIGHGFDVHALAEGLPMWLGGVRIESPTGFVAHSDGDVAIHALCDALLGCIGAGDIGHIFPDTDEKWKGADSKKLLEIVMEHVQGAGWQLGNADITIAIEKPKLASYIIEMRKVLSGILGCPLDCISVKATTTEHLGFTGRSEGCAVWATALVWKQ